MKLAYNSTAPEKEYFHQLFQSCNSLATASTRGGGKALLQEFLIRQNQGGACQQEVWPGGKIVLTIYWLEILHAMESGQSSRLAKLLLIVSL